MGALETSKIAKDHEWYRLITCIWLHAGVVHILANMLSLLLIGIRLEKEFGFRKCRDNFASYFLSFLVPLKSLWRYIT
jgi:membrane associated rhomboid family serine protease